MLTAFNLRDSVNESWKDDQVDKEISLNKPWPRSPRFSWASSFPSSTFSLLFFVTYRKWHLIIFVSVMELAQTILPVITYSLVTIHLSQGLFTRTPCRKSDIFLASGITQLYNSSSDTHFYSTSCLEFSSNPIRSHFCKCPDTTFIPPRITVIRRSFHTKSAKTRTSLSSGTVIHDVNHDTNTSLNSSLCSLSIFSEYNRLVRITPAFVHYLWIIAFF